MSHNSPGYFGRPPSYAVKAERYREGTAEPCATHRKLCTGTVCRLIEVEEKVPAAFHWLRTEQRTMSLPVRTAGHRNRANCQQLTCPYVTSRYDAGDAPWEQSCRSPARTKSPLCTETEVQLTETPYSNLKGRGNKHEEKEVLLLCANGRLVQNIRSYANTIQNFLRTAAL